MEKRKLHIPEGTLDVLPSGVIFRRKLEDAVMKAFGSFGYNEVRTPIFEFFDVFAEGGGEISSESMYRFFDSKGRMLALRPDMTMPAVRLAATKLTDEPMPLRLSYCGAAFRNCESVQGARLREFTQAGVELIGIKSALADAEVVAAAIKALLSAGLGEFQIEIGQTDFFKGLLEQARLTLSEGEALRVAIDKKDALALSEILNKMDISEGLRAIFSGLPEFFGKIEQLGGIDEGALGRKSAAALENLREIYSILTDFGYEKYISVDLGMVQNIGYYTGAIFRGYARGIGFPICGGGRYDGLCGQFGRKAPATGIAIGVDRLASALQKQGAKAAPPPREYILVFPNGAHKAAFREAERLRAGGAAVRLALGDEEAAAEAAKSGAQKIIRIKS